MKFNSLMSIIGFIIIIYIAPLYAEGSIPSLNSTDLAKGSFSSMHMLLEKTIFNVDIVSIDIRFGKKTQHRFAEILRDRKEIDGLQNHLVKVAIEAEHAVVQMHFRRSMSFEVWMGHVLEHIDQAHQAGLISTQHEKYISNQLPLWFAPLKEQGIEESDRVFYQVKPQSLRAVVVSAFNKSVLVDRKITEKGISKSMLATFFAPKCDFREPLLYSLFNSR